MENSLHKIVNRDQGEVFMELLNLKNYKNFIFRMSFILAMGSSMMSEFAYSSSGGRSSSVLDIMKFMYHSIAANKYISTVAHGDSDDFPVSIIIKRGAQEIVIAPLTKFLSRTNKTYENVIGFKILNKNNDIEMQIRYLQNSDLSIDGGLPKHYTDVLDETAFTVLDPRDKNINLIEMLVVSPSAVNFSERIKLKKPLYKRIDSIMGKFCQNANSDLFCQSTNLLKSHPDNMAQIRNKLHGYVFSSNDLDVASLQDVIEEIMDASGDIFTRN